MQTKTYCLFIIAGLIFLFQSVVFSQVSFDGIISFSSDMDGDNEIYLRYPNNNELIKLTDNTWDDFGHGWSSDGAQMAFSSNRDGNYEIYIMDPEGNNQTRITYLPGSYDFQPRWSPDGTKIAFTRQTNSGSDIYVMDCDGSNIQQLTNHPAYDSGPAWSPDGTKIVFDSQRTGYADLFIMKSDGDSIINITNTPGIHDISAVWSPLGDKIAYQKEVGDFWEIILYDILTQSHSQLTFINADNQQPAYSPDGNMIVFLTRQDPGPNHDIWIMDTSGNNLQQLTSDLAQDWYPYWLSDISTCINESINQGQFEIYYALNNKNIIIEFYLAFSSFISFKIYNLSGGLMLQTEKIKMQSGSDCILLQEIMPCRWKLKSGIYIITLETDYGNISSKKLYIK